MIFETDPAGRVTSFRGGRAREVGYIEGTVSGCHAQTLRGMKWTVTRLKTAGAGGVTRSALEHAH